MYEIRFTPQAERAYLHVDEQTQKRIDRILEQFERGEFHHANIRALQGRFAGSLRYRMGSRRILFHIERDKRVVWIESITTRGDAYKR